MTLPVRWATRTASQWPASAGGRPRNRAPVLWRRIAAIATPGSSSTMAAAPRPLAATAATASQVGPTERRRTARPRSRRQVGAACRTPGSQRHERTPEGTPSDCTVPASSTPTARPALTPTPPRPYSPDPDREIPQAARQGRDQAHLGRPASAAPSRAASRYPPRSSRGRGRSLPGAVGPPSGRWAV